MTGRGGFNRRKFEQKKIDTQTAENRLCEALGITPSGKGFFATLNAEIYKVGLNATQCAKCLRMGMDINGCTASELLGQIQYSQYMFEPTLKALIQVLRIAGALTDDEKDAIKREHQARGKSIHAVHKTVEECCANAVIAKCCAERGLTTPSVERGEISP